MSETGDRQLAFVIAQLRHAYTQLRMGHISDMDAFADGLIAPQIRTLERLARSSGSSSCEAEKKSEKKTEI